MPTRGAARQLEPWASRERGSALVLALLIMIIMTMLGLAFMLMGDTEARIARNQRDRSQAGYVAEGGVRVVQKWFEEPSPSSYSGAAAALAPPTVAQMNRTLRWIDHDLDGTWTAYASLPSPWNQIYRQATNDPFERPYRGTAAQMLLGNEANPDVRISETGSAAEAAFLAALNTSLYGSFPAANQRARITQIDVYGPPVINVSGALTRYGSATIKVTSGVFEHAGTPQERRIGTAIAKAVLSEIPYVVRGPIQSCGSLNINGSAEGRWGMISTVNTMVVHTNLDGKNNSGIPWFDMNRIIARDMDLNGTLQTGTPGSPTPDDRDGNGTLDFDQWIAGPDVEDPWLRYWSEGDLTAGGVPISPGCTTANCQPRPFFIAPNTFGTGTTDHSNMFKNVTQTTCLEYDYAFWKDIAQRGGTNVFYYAYSGGGLYRLNGTGPSVTMQTATNAGNGLYFFDSADNNPVVDANSDGTYDNLAPDIVISGGGWTGGGFIYLNANFRTTGSGSVSSNRTLIAPAEPYIDANANGAYDTDEWFIDLTYPNSPTGSYVKHAMRRADQAPFITRQDPSVDAGTAGRYSAGINMSGLLYTNGAFTADGNWIYFGSVVAKSGMTSGLAGNPVFYFDERMVKGSWPPSELNLPRTVLTAWQTDL